MALPKIPIDMKTLAKASQVFESESDAEILIEVLVEASASHTLVALCREVFVVRSDTAELTVARFADEMPNLNKDASLTIVIAGTSPILRRVMEIALWSGMNCLFLTEDAAALIATVPEEDAVDIAKNIVEVDVSKPQETLEQDLAKWCVTNLPDFRLSFGAAFPFMRHAIALDLTRQTSLENAVIAAVFFLPGADLPILTMNQCKLLYQIAIINEIPISRERLVDAALVVASAFSLRGITRLVQRRLGPVGWLVRGTVALGATMAMGHIANELYRRGGGVVELASGKLSGKTYDNDDENAGVQESQVADMGTDVLQSGEAR